MRTQNSTDLVHLRNMAGAFADWSFIYRQSFSCLRPGGYIEILDFDDHYAAKNFYAHFPADSDIHHVTRQVEEATGAHLSCPVRRSLSSAGPPPKPLLTGPFLSPIGTSSGHPPHEPRIAERGRLC